MCEQTISKLELLTNQLPNMNVAKRVGHDFIEMEVQDGIAISFGLIKRETLAIARTIGSCGTKFPKHTHNETEYVIVAEGKLSVTINNEVKLLTAGDCILIKPGSVHSAVALSNVELVAITIPASKGFPSDGAK